MQLSVFQRIKLIALGRRPRPRFFESTGEVRPPLTGEFFLTGLPQLAAERGIARQSSILPQTPRLIMRAVELEAESDMERDRR